jgi:hypothetical protein
MAGNMLGPCYCTDADPPAHHGFKGLPTEERATDLVRVVDADVFDGQPLPLGGAFNETIIALQNACLSDTNGKAAIITLDHYLRMERGPAPLAAQKKEPPLSSRKEPK